LCLDVTGQAPSEYGKDCGTISVTFQISKAQLSCESCKAEPKAGKTVTSYDRSTHIQVSDLHFDHMIESCVGRSQLAAGYVPKCKTALKKQD